MLRTKSRSRHQPRQYPINLKKAKTLGLTIPPMLLTRGRGDRITTFSTAASNVCFWHKADMAIAPLDVRFWG
jgi:hypothetical protein